MAYKCVKIFLNGRWVEHYPNGRPTNAQRQEQYFSEIRALRNAAGAAWYARTVAMEDEQTAQLSALVIADGPRMDETIRASVRAIRDANGLTKACVNDAINAYKDFLLDSSAECAARNGEEWESPA